MSQKSTLTSRSETTAVATGFAECLQYVISTNQADEAFCKRLIASQLMPVLSWCLTEELSCFKSICKQIAGLVQSWSRNSAKSKVFEKYLQFFFDLTVDCLSEIFSEDFAQTRGVNEQQIVVVTDRQLEFLHSLKHVPKPRRKSHVTFVQEDTDVAKKDSEASSASVYCDDKYLELLNNLVFELCRRYVDYINEHHGNTLIPNLYSLVAEFDTMYILTKLNNKMKASNPEARFLNIYTDILEEWYKNKLFTCKQVVDLAFLLFKYISDEDKDKILESLTQVNKQ